MEKIKSFQEFLTEKNSSKNSEDTKNNLFNFTFESEAGDFTLNINEGFVKELQAHIRKTIDILIGEYNIKSGRIDKHLEKNLLVLTTSFQEGDSPEETAKKIS